MDECEATAARFKIESLPTILFMRSQAMPPATTASTELINSMMEYQLLIEKSREEGRLLVLQFSSSKAVQSQLNALAAANGGNLRVALVNSAAGAAATSAPIFKAAGVVSGVAAIRIWNGAKLIEALDADEVSSRLDEAISRSLSLVKSLRPKGTTRTPARFQVRGTMTGAEGGFFGAFFARIIANSTGAELQLLRRFESDQPDEHDADVLNNLATSVVEADMLATEPLSSCCQFVTKHKRVDLKMEEVSAQLSFDVSRHESAQTAPAVSILNRFNDDVAAYATWANTEDIAKVVKLLDDVVDGYFAGQAEAEVTLSAALEATRRLLVVLHDLKKRDGDMVEKSIQLIEKAANWVQFDVSDSLAASNAKTRFVLNRHARQNSSIWIEFLFGSLLSSHGEEDLLRLNPFMSPQMLTEILNLVTTSMLRANRLGHTNRCIGTCISLEALLNKVHHVDQSMHSCVVR